jgi:hypothetical protein
LTIGFIGFSNTARDYTYKSLLHSDQCSQSRCLVTAPTADVPLLPGSRPFWLATTLTLMASRAINKLSVSTARKQAVAYCRHSPAWLFLVLSPIGTHDHIFVLIYKPYAIRRWAFSSVRGGVGLFSAAGLCELLYLRLPLVCLLHIKEPEAHPPRQDSSPWGGLVNCTAPVSELYSLRPDPVENAALTLLSGQQLSSNAFFLCCLSSRYLVTSTPQAYGVYVTISIGVLY